MLDPEDQSSGRQLQATPMDAARNVIGVFAKICLYISALMLAAITIINGVNVFSRYILFHAISWAEEAMVFLMIGTVFFGAIPVTWNRIHIRIDALIHKFSPRARIYFEALVVLITAAVLLPIGWLSIEVVDKLRMFDQRSDALDWPVWIPQIVVPIALMLIPVIMALSLTRRAGEPHDNPNN